jgi:hypothetical protein
VRSVADVVVFLAGAVLVVSALLSVIRATVLPRAAQSRISNVTFEAVRLAFHLRAKRATEYKDRDRIMAMLAPLSLLAMLAVWLVLIIAGYSLMFWAVTGRSVTRSVQLSGSSVFTLGTATDARLWPSLGTYSEAALGLLIVALLITYFPTIYSAFTRREAGVSLLQVRAGNPPQATTMLIRFHRIEEAQFRLGELWRQWEAWFADVEESHTTFPVLCYFRSPHPERSWITSAGALLDAAGFWAGCVDHPADPDVQLCIRAGYLALRRISDELGITYDPDPQPGDPITVHRGEWEAAMDEMQEAGLPLRADRDEAWTAWKGWRVNYDTPLLLIARLIEAPPAPWVSDRSPTPAAPRRRAGDRRLGRRSSEPGLWPRRWRSIR